MADHHTYSAMPFAGAELEWGSQVIHNSVKSSACLFSGFAVQSRATWDNPLEGRKSGFPARVAWGWGRRSRAALPFVREVSPLSQSSRNAQKLHKGLCEGTLSLQTHSIPTGSPRLGGAVPHCTRELTGSKCFPSFCRRRCCTPGSIRGPAAGSVGPAALPSAGHVTSPSLKQTEPCLALPFASGNGAGPAAVPTGSCGDTQQVKGTASDDAQDPFQICIPPSHGLS